MPQRELYGETPQEKRSRLNFEESTNDYFSNLLWVDDWDDCFEWLELGCDYKEQIRWQ
jgi:hypothetical protein